MAKRLTRGYERVVTIEWEGVKSISHVHLDFLEEVKITTNMSDTNTQLPVDYLAPVDPLHFLQWMAGYSNEIGEELQLVNNQFKFIDDELDSPITTNGIVQLYFLHNPDKATAYATKLLKCDKTNSALEEKNRQIMELLEANFKEALRSHNCMTEDEIIEAWKVYKINNNL